MSLCATKKKMFFYNNIHGLEGVQRYLDNLERQLKLVVCFQDELRIIISTRDHLVRTVSGNLKYVLGYPSVSVLYILIEVIRISVGLRLII